MDKWFHLTLYNGCNDLSMLGLKLNHVSKRAHLISIIHWIRSYCAMAFRGGRLSAKGIAGKWPEAFIDTKSDATNIACAKFIILSRFQYRARKSEKINSVGFRIKAQTRWGIEILVLHHAKPMSKNVYIQPCNTPHPDSSVVSCVINMIAWASIH